MYKSIRKDYWIADSKKDLARLSEREKDMGATCLVIDEACEYRLMSTGEWKKQVSSTSEASGEVDLTGYATKNYVDNAVANIKVPDISNLATKDSVQAVADKIPAVSNFASISDLDELKNNPVFKIFDLSLPAAGGGQYGIYLNKADGRTLVDVLKEKGLGLYNVWIEKGRADLPRPMREANLSARGFACIDYYNNPDDMIGYVVLFNKNNEMYYRFYNHNTFGPWCQVAVEQYYED